MKKNSRIVALFLALVLILGLMTACGNDPASSTPASSSAEASSDPPSEAPAAPSEEASTPEASVVESSAAESSSVEDSTVESAATWPENPLGNVDLPLTDEPITVTMWMGVNPNVLKITEDIGNDCVLWNELATRTGVHLDFTVVNPDTESEKFNLMVASNDLTDIISNATTLYTNGGELLWPMKFSLTICLISPKNSPPRSAS